ncbi:hypothetical protein ACO2Q3_02085 [Caulobacter sp. KR2-114]|uniref:hypothetical protein n=1 Tax=Caulobacter sp. KR2-114 TaxID=3400912 RepID=UPI003C10D2FF
MKFRNILLAAMGLTMAAGAVSTASAATPWQDHHPRRVEVNHRLNNENHRIRVERREGELSARQAHRLHKADYRIRLEERRMAMRHHGHLTRAEQHRLNRQENRLSHRID